MRSRLSLATALGLAVVLMAPVAAGARPLSTQGVEVEWLAQSTGNTEAGRITIAIDEVGRGSVVIDARRFRAFECADKSIGLLSEYWTGQDSNAAVTGTFGKRLVSARTTATATVQIRTESTCDGSSSLSMATVTVDVTAVASTRIDRSRDRDSGTRTLSRTADSVSLVYNGASLPAGATIFESIARS